ncbi:YmfQ family protein [Alkaliphilus metalliredigens]|nr:YmfQ family protein [Alkaliphilus metalliredigens]
MFKTVSPIYYQSKLMQAILQSVGTEWDDVDEITDDILLQLFPQTATWGLRYWEELLKIPVNNSIPIERRRALVMYRIKLRAPMTPARIANVTKSLAGDFAEYVEVLENVEPHVFMVTIGTAKSGIDYLSIYREIKRIKPSHESFYLGNRYSRGFNLERKDVYGFSKIIHAIGTFVCSKEDVEFIATKGYRTSDDIKYEKNTIRGTSDPLVCSKELIYTTEGFLSEGQIENSIQSISGTSHPLSCSKDLVYETQGFLDESGLDQQVNSTKGASSPLVCSKNLKYTRIEVV